MEIHNFIVKVTSECNLNCSYCYANNVRAWTKQKKIMTGHTLENVVRGILNFSQPNVCFIWHGGEPLLAGRDFFQKALFYQHKYSQANQCIRNSIQTNATLMTPEWSKFLAENNFHIGISIDGPEIINDQFRKSQSGEGTFGNTMKGIRYIQEYHRNIGILAVVTKSSLPYAPDIFAFFREHKIFNYDLLPYAEYHKEKGQMTSASLSPSEFADFMINIFDIWFKLDNPEIEIRFFENVLLGLLGQEPSNCTFSGRCHEHLAIEANGDVYHCDWFSGQRDKCFGNINELSLETIVKTRKYQSYIAKIKQTKEECKSCPWSSMCHGGCAYYRVIQGDFESPFYFCSSRKSIFKHVKKHLQRAQEFL